MKKLKTKIESNNQNNNFFSYIIMINKMIIYKHNKIICK